MKFFQNLVAATLGTLIALFLVFIVLFITLASSTGEPEPYIRENTVLKIDISGNLPAQSTKDPLEELFNRGRYNKVSLETLKENLAKAKSHERVKGVWLEIDFVTEGWANLEEAHRMIKAFRDSTDKFVYASTNDLGFNEQGYYLATASDSIFSPPESFFEFDGFFTQVAFYKGLFDKIGIDANIARVGKYKSAVEPYMRKEFSEESKLQLSALIDQSTSTFMEAVSRKTGLSTSHINSLMSDSPRLLAGFGYENGLIDSLMYTDEVEQQIKKRIGIKENADLKTVSNARYARVTRQSAGLKSGDDSNKIAVIYADGPILPEMNGGNPFDKQQYITTAFFDEQLGEIREDDRIKALVVRVNSPGGSGSTSDAILRMLKEVKKDMPVIVSMGPVAASGGYYISMEADTIVASPTTITGSIGVFATKFNTKQLFNEELGITFDEVKSHPHAGWLLPTTDFTPSEEKAFNQFVETFYDTFIGKVADARGLSRQQVHEVAQGRVWTGEAALNHNLVDVLGGLDKAMEIAAEKAELKEYAIETYPKRKDIYELLMGSAEMKARSFLGDRWFFNSQLEQASRTLSILKRKGPLAYFPYEITIQ